jgi:hypothetical protein
MTMWSPHLRRVEEKYLWSPQDIRSYLGELLGEFIVGLIVVFIVGYVDIQWYKAVYTCILYFDIFLLIIVIVLGIRS